MSWTWIRKWWGPRRRPGPACRSAGPTRGAHWRAGSASRPRATCVSPLSMAWTWRWSRSTSSGCVIDSNDLPSSSSAGCPTMAHIAAFTRVKTPSSPTSAMPIGACSKAPRKRSSAWRTARCGLALGGDVLVHRHRHEAVLGMLEHRHRRVGPEDRAVLPDVVHVPAPEPVLGDGALDLRGHVLRGAPRRRVDAIHVHLVQLAGPVSEDLLEAAVGEDDPVVGVAHQEHALGHVLGDLALESQLGLDQPATGDVQPRAEVAGGRPIRVVDRRRAPADPGHGPVGAQQAVLHLEGLARLDRPLPPLGHRPAVVGVHQVEVAHRGRGRRPEVRPSRASARWRR